MDPFNQLPCSLSLVWKEREKKKWWKGWTVKSRLGNELLVIYSGYRGCQCERGLALHKRQACRWVLAHSVKPHTGLVQWQCCSKQ